ncbi:GNAT family N-acetyltransferase [Chiayiivirga flava]|uniref:N-acetyltransferase domain-containing protein n=1 Tax=Chiayiivirga flava TaxID=659595 RepID=A0A7W8FZU6_9GAMM|nr:GNAT family N-acetyltransferase [Chiayiivirga flava]MBB5208491.1 hypothetical protein [Chiayiivirga flava]
MAFDIVHDRLTHRFTVAVDGELCLLEYHLNDGVMTITHTGVPDAVGGRGIAASLVTAAFDAAREEGWKVVPRCAYAEAYVQKHRAEIGDLLA